MENETIQELKDQEQETEPSRNKMFGGIFMILMGGVALLAVSGVELFGRSPWMLFGLLPVYWIVVTAYNKYKANGNQLNRQVVGTLLFCLIPFAYILFIFFGWSVNILWPMTIIFIGLGIILFRDK